MQGTPVRQLQRRVGLRELQNRRDQGAGVFADGIDDLAGCRAVCAADLVAGSRRLAVDPGDEQASLDLAQVVQPRDDLLSGVTTLVEADAVEPVEITRLPGAAILRRKDSTGDPACACS